MCSDLNENVPHRLQYLNIVLTCHRGCLGKLRGYILFGRSISLKWVWVLNSLSLLVWFLCFKLMVEPLDSAPVIITAACYHAPQL